MIPPRIGRRLRAGAARQTPTRTFPHLYPGGTPLSGAHHDTHGVMMKRNTFGTLASLLAFSLAACTQAQDAEDAPLAKPTHGEKLSQACSSVDAETGELVPFARLIQMHVELRYRTNYLHEFRADDGSASERTEMHALVEGSADLLACTWKEFGRNQYMFHPASEDELPPFPNTASGSASLEGARTASALVHSETITSKETVQANGKLRGLTLSIPTRDESTADENGTCIQVGFDAPMTGSLVLDVTSTDGNHKHEESPPASLEPSTYSAFAVRTYNQGESEFTNNSLTLCDGPRNRPDAIPQELPARGMTISADESVWTRNGEWIGHNSLPAERRYIDFSLKIVPRTLQYPNP
jgi:hypothetical protein